MKRLLVLGLVLAIAAPALAAPTLLISLGVRERASTITPVAAPGDFVPNHAGQIEWFELDEQVLTLDGTWQQFTFDLSATGISSVSMTGNGVIDADQGTLEHIRFRTTEGLSIPVTVWTDQIRDNYDPTGLPPANDKLISTFDGVAGNGGVPYADGTEVMFQEPRFSGSTSGDLALTPNISGIDNADGHDDLHSVKAQWDFIYPDPTPATTWLRYTTYLAGNTFERNPVLALKGGPNNSYAASTVTLWLKGVPEPGTMSLMVLGAIALLRRR